MVAGATGSLHSRTDLVSLVHGVAPVWAVWLLVCALLVAVDGRTVAADEMIGSMVGDAIGTDSFEQDLHAVSGLANAASLHRLV